MNFEESVRLIDKMSADGADATAIAGVFAGLVSSGNHFLAAALAAAKNPAKLFTPELAKAWPEDSLGLFVKAMVSLPYLPRRSTMPCGPREECIAAILRDRSVPRATRAQTWKGFVMSGLKLPAYVTGIGAWAMPPELVDHQAYRRWAALSGAPGGNDLKNSDPWFFGKEQPPSDKDAAAAIAADSPSALLMPLHLAGKGLSAALVRAVLAARAEKILVYLIIDSSKKLARVCPPRSMLFYLCANWNNDDAIPVLSLLEHDSPGLIRDTVDAFGHDALWYTLYQHDRFGAATPAARRATDPLDVFLIENGCDPDRESSVGLSWRDVTEAVV